MYRVYVAHPYGGNEDNKYRVEEIVKALASAEGKGTCLISPIHTFGFLYDTVSYVQGMDMCLDLLSTCDELVLCPGWENSKGCLMEYAYAKGKEIKISNLNAWIDVQEVFGDED